MVGVAVASQELKVLHPNGVSEDTIERVDAVRSAEQQIISAAIKILTEITEEVDSEPNGESDEPEANKDDDVLVLPYNEQGLNEILRIASEQSASTVVLAGNRLWAKAIAYALAAHNIEVRYVAPRKQERGKVTSQVKFLQNALEHGITGRPFFGQRYKNGASSKDEEQVAHPWVELAKHGAVLNDDLRRVKHHIQNILRLIFPELIFLEQKLWGKRAIMALEAGEFSFFARYGLDYEKSLARYIPIAETVGKRDELAELLCDLHLKQNKRAEYEDEIERLTQDHPIARMFEGSNSAKELTLLVGWQKWGRSKDNADQRRASFRRLRKYCGLDVSRIDSKGNPRISRERPEIRVALYHLLKTGVAKQILAEAKKRLGRDKMKRPKRMEILLKAIWKQCLLEET